ncbi:MAG TPA: S-methyl-5-thioribose-1-phosphate isomerase [Anaerolineales bacterium]|nr:S-methyl-5-thioribose-1-phosphate isomerase [Anaerolineales bacterium]
MKIEGKNYRTIWLDPEHEEVVQVIDQRYLPFEFVVENLRNIDEVAVCIKEMHIRGAGLIGATAGYGVYIAALQAKREGFPVGSSEFMSRVVELGKYLKRTRPTAVNLEWGVDRTISAMLSAPENSIQIALKTANEIADEDADFCRRIGEHGVEIIEKIYQSNGGKTVNILTHCNAGWLAFVDYGTATAPIYAAQAKGIPIHVYVDETRPRNQGARLTAYELGEQGVAHTVIADNVGGHLMQHGLVDMVITGTDRTTYTGDVANKIGTYLKALAAKDNNVPFYVALPSSTFDWEMTDGVRQIPVEEREGDEVTWIEGWTEDGVKSVRLTPEKSRAVNYGFDVTPARLITGLITERGICKPDKESILALYPENRKS